MTSEEKLKIANDITGHVLTMIATTVSLSNPCRPPALYGLLDDRRVASEAFATKLLMLIDDDGK